MNLKGLLKERLQRNLDQQYIKKTLRLIANRPFLYIIGNSFSSTSDKYLNIFSLKSIKNAYSESFPTAYGSLFLPYELFHALKIVPFLPEVMAGYSAGLGLADKALKKASSNWYSQDLCTFHRCASGAVELDLFPKPHFIICTNLACDSAQKSFYIYSKHFNIQKNFYLIDVPYQYNSKSIKYLSGQLKDISFEISKKLKTKPDLDRFKRVIELSNKFRDWALKVNNIRKNLQYYPKNYNGLNFILPFHSLAGTIDAVILYQKMYRELYKYLKTDNKKDYKKLKKRLLWLHLKPYYKNEIFSIIENENFSIAFEEMNYVYWQNLNPDKPFESLAKKMLSHFLRGSMDNRINAVLKMARDYRIDGAVLFSHWGCRQSNGGARIIKDSLKQYGIPALVLDGDCVDKNNQSCGQFRTRIQGFLEILNSK